MIFLNSLKKSFYKFRRTGSRLFTYNCASCGKAIRGKCICEECEKTIIPANNPEIGYASAYYYDGAAKKAVLCCKFHGGEYCMDFIIDGLISAYAHFKGIDFDFAVPVPAFKFRKTMTYRMTKEFSFLMDIPFEPTVLKKIRKTKKQHDILAFERKTNLIDAFEASSKVKGKTILLIDDIITTGATAYECSKALIKAGAARVCVLTVLKSAHKK